MPFFDQPGYHAGPFSAPAQPGILSKILQGVNVAMKIGDFYQDWQSKTQARENAGLQGIVNQVKLARELNPETPVSLEGGLGEKIENALKIKLPRVTEASRAKMGEGVMSGIAPVAGEVLPGGGMGVRLNSPELAGKQEQFTQGMAAIPGVGGFAPIMPKSKKIGVLAPDGTLKTIDAGAGIDQIIQQKVAPQYGVWDGDNFIPTPGRPTMERQYETPEQRRQRELDVQGERNKRTTGGGGARGGGGLGRLTSAEIEQQEKMQFMKDNPGSTAMDYYHAKARAKRIEYDTTTTKDSEGLNQKTQKRNVVRPLPTTLDKAFEGAINPMSPTVTPAPAGKVDLGPPIGRAPDGRLIYKGKNGKPVTID